VMISLVPYDLTCMQNWILLRRNKIAFKIADIVGLQPLDRDEWNSTHTYTLLFTTHTRAHMYVSFHFWFVMLILFELDSLIENLYPELRGAVLVCSVPPSGNR